MATSSDTKGITFNLIVVILFCQPFGVYLATLIISNLSLTPYSQLYSLFEENKWRIPLLANLALLFLRLTIFIPLFVIYRTTCLFVCVPVMGLYLFLECISTLDQTAYFYLSSRNKANMDKYLQRYASCRVIYAIADQFTAPCVATLMFAGLCVSILFNFISLNMYGIIPPYAFPFFLPFLHTLLWS